MRTMLHIGSLLTACLLAACVGGNGTAATGPKPIPATQNTLALTVDTGPAAATGQVNHAYVTVKVCAPGSQTQCASIDHVMLDTGSSGLRLVGSVLAAASVTLAAETDSNGQAITECMGFGGGQTWGQVVLADITMAGETAAKLPLQIIDDTGAAAPAPASCTAIGPLIAGVSGFGANGVFGVSVLPQDCGANCVSGATPLPFYYGCTSAGVCTAENIPLAQQVPNPVTAFAVDNNGVIVNMPNLINANGDNSVQGELIFGISTQADNTLLPTVTVLGANAQGYFTATFNGSTTVLPAIIDSGTDGYSFYDATIPACQTGLFNGYYCPAVAPMAVYAVNVGVGTYSASSTVNFAIADPNSFTPTAAAFSGLAGGGTNNFIWGMPFFYGRTIYFGFAQHTAGTFTGPFYAY